MSIEKLKESLAKSQDKLQKFKEKYSCAFEDVESEEKDLVSRRELFMELDSLFRFVISEVDTVHERLNGFVENHLDGHLPHVKSNEQLQRAIDLLGLTEEFKVAPKNISVGYTKDGKADKIQLVLEKVKKDNKENINEEKV